MNNGLSNKFGLISQGMAVIILLSFSDDGQIGVSITLLGAISGVIETMNLRFGGSIGNYIGNAHVNIVCTL